MRKEMSSCLKLERHFEDILNGVLFILNGFVQNVSIKDVLNLYQRSSVWFNTFNLSFSYDQFQVLIREKKNFDD